MRQTVIVATLVLSLTGCATHRRSSVATVSQDSQGRYEIRLDKVEWVAGGPCNIEWPHRIYPSDWIYTASIDGEIPADHLVLTHERGKTEYPWPQEGLCGSVTFTNGQMQVLLKILWHPEGKESVNRYMRYNLNGRYTLERE